MQITDLIIKKTSNIPVAIAAYEKIVLSVLDEILRRYEANSDYPFIDTKLDLISGEDFATDDQIKGKNTIYSWIQSRGMEALATHAQWIRNNNNLTESLQSSYSERITKIVSEVFEQMESIRTLNGGHVPCMMTPDGTPLQPASSTSVEVLPYIKSSHGTLSDLFYAKGLASAADLLRSSQKMQEAETMFDNIVDDLFADKFIFDQKSLDPKNEISTDCILEGGFMISIGAAALFLKLTEKPKYWNIGLKLIRHIIKNYVNTSSKPEYGKQFDMWEEVDSNGVPVLKSGNIRSDSGHVLEFAGLSLKLIYLAEKKEIISSDDIEISELINTLCGIITANFANGFSEYGIVKAFDIVQQQAINTDMPWWSLPESMRSASFAHYFRGEKDNSYLEIVRKCSNVFAEYFLNEKVHWMAYQTLNEKGQPIKVIPATPDADPGYHTGLSLLDLIELPLVYV